MGLSYLGENGGLDFLGELGALLLVALDASALNTRVSKSFT